VIAACGRTASAWTNQPVTPARILRRRYGAGEVALCRPLHASQGAFAGLERRRPLPYPPALREHCPPLSSGKCRLPSKRRAAAQRRAERMLPAAPYRAFACTAQVLFALNARLSHQRKGLAAAGGGGFFRAR